MDHVTVLTEIISDQSLLYTFSFHFHFIQEAFFWLPKNQNCNNSVNLLCGP